MSLLALLTLAGERGLSRERTQSYLWPENDEARARHALDQLIYATRRDLGHNAIISSATEIRLNPAVIDADVWAFDRAVRDERWEDAVNTYSGPLLNGQHLADSAELEQWIASEQTQRAQDHLRALDALAAAATLRGDPMGAVRWRRKQAAADPFSVPVALDLMRALEAANDRTGALTHARLYQKLVTTTLEIEADPAVMSLASAIAARRNATTADSMGDVSSGIVSVEPNERYGIDANAPNVAASSAKDARRWRRSGRVTALGVGLSALAAVFLSRSESAHTASTPGAAAPMASVARSTRPPAPAKPRPHQTNDAEARSLFLHARASWEKRTKEPLDEAVVLFRKATERDPEYAAAYAGLAQSYAMLGYFGFAPADAMFPKAKAAARRAIELDAEAGDAYAALGQALAWQHAWTESEAAYRRALELTPGDATAHQWYALLLAYLGRSREAALHSGHASRLDPLSVQVNNMHGIMLYYAGDLDAALRQYERTVDAEPDSAWVRQNPWVLTNFSRVAAAAGRHALAVRLVERALEHLPSHPRPLFDLAYAEVVAGEPDIARTAFARADTTHPHYVVYRALLHGVLDERDAAFAWFDRVVEWPLPSLVTLNSEPRLARLRADPRFERVRVRLNMSPR